MQIRNNTIKGNVGTISLIDITTGSENNMTKKDVIERIHYISVLATRSSGAAHAAHKNMIAYYEEAIALFNEPDLEDMYF